MPSEQQKRDIEPSPGHWFQWLIARRRGPQTKCADCPIVMKCGLEPQKECLGRLEALAHGSRRQPGAWDTCITGLMG